MKRPLRAALLAGATGLGCTVIAFGYWIDSIRVKTDVTVLYPVEITVVQPEKTPLPEEIPTEKTPLESVPSDDTNVKAPPQGEAGFDKEDVTNPENAQALSGDKAWEKPAPGAPSEPTSPADSGVQPDTTADLDENASADSPEESTGGADSGAALDAGAEASGESAPDSGMDGGAHEGTSD